MDSRSKLQAFHVRFWKQDFRRRSFWLCLLSKVDVGMMLLENGSSNGAAAAFANQSPQTPPLGNETLEKLLGSQWTLTARSEKAVVTLADTSSILRYFLRLKKKNKIKWMLGTCICVYFINLFIPQVSIEGHSKDWLDADQTHFLLFQGYRDYIF